MASCRNCGAICSEWELRSVDEGGGCVSCGGSPRCRDCGHRRSDHFGSFSGARLSGCKAKDSDFQTLTVQSCGCIGFTAS
jgi:hypothetical protein